MEVEVMKTSTKQYRYLKKYVGKEIIRIKPHSKEDDLDYSFTAAKGTLHAIRTNEMEVMYEGLGIMKLPFEWLDGNWYSVEDVKRFPKTKLNKLRGKEVRTKKGKFGSGYGVNSFKSYEGILLFATKYHVVLRGSDGREQWLNCRCTNPADWQKA